MKAFRNTGIEGGYASLATQNYLLGLRRQIQRGARVTGQAAPRLHSRGAKEPTAKTVADPFPKRSSRAKLTALLLKYADCAGAHGNWSDKQKLLEVQLIRELRKPDHEYAYRYCTGGHYEITAKGRAYIDLLMAPCVKEQMSSGGSSVKG